MLVQFNDGQKTTTKTKQKNVRFYPLFIRGYETN